MTPDDELPMPFPRPSVLIGRDDVKMALEAGFTPDEIRFRIDIPTDHLVNGEEVGLTGFKI